MTNFTARLAIGSRFAGRYLFILCYSYLLAGLIHFLFELESQAAITTCTLFLVLTYLQVWSDLFDLEPITMWAYDKFRNVTGFDPRQTDALIESRILPLCDAFNSLPGTETVFSCQGHLRAFFQGYLPKIHRVGPYVMFKTNQRELMRKLSTKLHKDMQNNWTLTARYRPLAEHDGSGGDFVWTLRCERTVGFFWHQRAIIDAELTTISNYLHGHQ